MKSIRIIWTAYVQSVTDKTFEISTNFCEKFKNGFVYWSFGFFIYQMYSADSFEVLLLFICLSKIEFIFIFSLDFLYLRKWLRIQNISKKVFHINICSCCWAMVYWQAQAINGLLGASYWHQHFISMCWMVFNQHSSKLSRKNWWILRKKLKHSSFWFWTVNKRNFYFKKSERMNWIIQKAHIYRNWCQDLLWIQFVVWFWWII